MNTVKIPEQDELENLVIKAKEGDSSAANTIYKAFNKYIYKTAMSDCFKGYSLENLMKLGNESIATALKLYKLGDSDSFIPYAARAINKGFRRLIRGNVLRTNL